jgi:hypothetical protein
MVLNNNLKQTNIFSTIRYYLLLNWITHEMVNVFFFFSFSVPVHTL